MPSGALISSLSSSSIQSSNMQKLQAQNPHRAKTHCRSGSGSGFKPKFESLTIDVDVSPSSIVSRTDSPDNDSAFSDNVSMLSSESSASSGASGGGGITSKLDARKLASSSTSSEQAAKVKAEKIKMALEKLKEANVKKLFIKAFSQDGSSKSLLVDEKMTVAQVCRMLTDKNHFFEQVAIICSTYTNIYKLLLYYSINITLYCSNLFQNRPDKYNLFVHPEKYLLYGNSSQVSSDIDDEARNNLIEEFFSSSRVPEVEGPLFLKSEGKKAWKKFYFVLRQSGLYYCPKGKSSRSSKDLVCLATLDNNQVYHGIGWKKKFKAPTDWGFAIKVPHLQAKSSKHIKYLCSEDANSLNQWIMGIRIAKDIAQEDIDLLASSRSFSLASVTASSRGPSEATTPSSESRSLDSCLAPSLQEEDADDGCSSADSSSQDTPVNTLCRAPQWRHDSLRSGSSSSSSGCLSERSSSTGTPPIEGGFEADFPQQGTIKRKPSSNPKLPLTSTTRHLVKEVDRSDDDSSIRTSSLRHSTRRSLSEEVSTLRRRNSSSTQGRTSVASSNGPSNYSIEEDEVDSLPLPPPPGDLPCDPDLLPPPPPELLASTLSLNSLPPPPEDVPIPIYEGESIMSESIISLPPPPPPTCLPKPSTPPQYTQSPPATPPKPKIFFPPSQPMSPPAVAPKPRRDGSSDSIYASRVVTSPTEVYSLPGNDNKFQPHSPSPPPPPPPVLNTQVQRSPQKKVKKITFLEDVQSFPPSPCPSPPCPTSPFKPPQPPRRSLSTKLTPHPGRLAAPGCKVTPPKSFLNNLQRVMQKKWQVAQKCRDFDKMPHEVLGFRDPLPQVEAERNVGAWIQEHYGSLYENLAPRVDSPTGTAPSNGAYIMDPPLPRQIPEAPSYSGNEYGSPRLSQTVPMPGSRKKAPPPPPKRSDTTQLSVRQ
ncbi:Abnormal cell migration protein 10 [Armadillidium vulgare]|nr:Abnormal cell migration protein 10 [Armadillidium vulgare]